jgi:hypothetical protein
MTNKHILLKNLKAENCPYFHSGGKDPPTKINYMTGTGEYLSQCLFHNWIQISSVQKRWHS